MTIYIEYNNIKELNPYHNNARLHSDKQVNQIANSIKEFGFISPILIDKDKNIIAGHGRIMAAQKLSIQQIPCVIIEHLNETQQRAYILADNKLAENASWDEQKLAYELQEILHLDFDVGVIGFSTAEMDLVFDSQITIGDEVNNDNGEIIDDDLLSPPDNPTAQLGDIWQLGRHRIICGNSLEKDTYEQLMSSKKASMIFTDPPYNVAIDGNVCGLGKVKHSEFAFASGEMSKFEFTEFLSTSFTRLVEHSTDGSIHYICMDWRHIDEISSAGMSAYSELKNICIWNKHNAGMGAFYRSKHEMIFVFKNGAASHINNFELGQHGRYRTNVWDYAGVNSFSRKDELKLHPTVKPVAMIEDAIKDCSHHGDIILDSFLGSGSTLIAAERSGRICYGIELEPKYIDVIISRWQFETGQKAICVNRNIEEVA